MPRRPTSPSALYLAAALALGACAGSAAPTSTPAPATGSAASRDALVGDVEALVSVAPAQHRERELLATELVADWRREAGNDKDSAAVIDLLRKELADHLAATPDGLELLRAEVYDRRTRALSRSSFALGKAVIDGAISDADARTQGTQLNDEVKGLSIQVRALKDAERARVLANDLQEVSLEATFAIARGATSRRLADYQATKAH